MKAGNDEAERLKIHAELLVISSDTRTFGSASHLTRTRVASDDYSWCGIGTASAVLRGSKFASCRCMGKACQKGYKGRKISTQEPVGTEPGVSISYRISKLSVPVLDAAQF